jgi:hypothetical protein
MPTQSSHRTIQFSSEITAKDIEQAEVQIRQAKSKARSAWDWSFIRDCEMALLEAKLQQIVPKIQ